MNTYIVVYELLSNALPGGAAARALSIAALEQALRSFGVWAQITNSCWAIRSDRAAVDIRNELRQFIQSTDRLMVVQTAHVAAWNYTLCNNEWLRENI